MRNLSFLLQVALILSTGLAVADEPEEPIVPERMVRLFNGRDHALDAKRLWMTAYTNDVPCYIVSKRIINEGGYEAKNSLSARATGGEPEKLNPPMEDRILGQVRALLPEGFLAR